MFDRKTTYPTQCTVCGIDLTRYEEEEPMKILTPVEGTKFHTERIVCDKCMSDHQALDMTAYNKFAGTYPFRRVSHI